ncbi:MAG: metalloregulator ArsR/SmtB family transcription factor [Bacteroidia bacterium]
MNIITLAKNPEKLKRVAKLLKIIGHPSRLLIVELLLEKNSLPVKEIFESVKISQSNASQHLKALEDVGILASERDGKNICYSIRNKEISKLMDCVNQCADC